MYTHIYCYFDKHNRLTDFGTHRGDTKDLAERAYDEAKRKNPRLRARCNAAARVEKHIVSTSSFISNPFMPSEDLFILACCISDLTITETNIVVLLKQGKSNKEIEQILNRSKDTVQKHLQNIYDKLKVRTRLKVVAAMEAKEHSLRFPNA